MLTLLLLPFFLAVRVSNNVDSWKNGPEYTYLVQINMLAVDEDGTAGRRSYDINAALKCRPRAPEMLHCRFDKSQGDYTEIKESVSDFDVSELAFDVIFNRFGIQELVVDKSLRPWEIDTIRAIINQLNFGYDPTNSPCANPFEEVSYLGESFTRVVTTKQLTEELCKPREVDFEIVPLGREKRPLEEVIDIEKTRIIEKSPGMANYFFGSKENNRDPPEDLVVKMKSSVSRIIISDRNFTSYTANEIHVTRDKVKNVTLYEKITLSLQSVAPAKTELQPLRNGGYAGFSVHQYSSKEN